MDDHLFGDECLIIFFSAAYTKKHVLCGGREGGGGGGGGGGGVGGGRSGEVALAYQVIKRLKIDFVALHAVSHSMPQRLQNVIKKPKAECWLLKF